MLLRGQTSLATPGDAQTAEIYLGHTGYRVQAGHRLRLQISSSDFPLYVVHPGTEQNAWFATVTKTNQQAISTGGSDASYLSLTVLPADAPQR
jgi:predicted acyl esterase